MFGPEPVRANSQIPFRKTRVAAVRYSIKPIFDQHKAMLDRHFKTWIMLTGSLYGVPTPLSTGSICHAWNLVASLDVVRSPTY